MAQAQQTKIGTLCWVDLPCDNMDRAQKFYSEVFGWEFQQEGDMPIRFTLSMGQQSTESPTPMAGLVPRSTGEEKILNYFHVPSLDEWAEKIKSAGGKVTKPKQVVPPYGSFSVCEDTEGNSFAIWESMEESS